MRYVPKRNVYLTPDGTATHDPDGGKNKLTIAAYAPVSTETATRLGLSALETQVVKKATVDTEGVEPESPLIEARTRGAIFNKEEWKEHEKAERAKAEAKPVKEPEKVAEPVKTEVVPEAPRTTEATP